MHVVVELQRKLEPRRWRAWHGVRRGRAGPRLIVTRNPTWRCGPRSGRSRNFRKRKPPVTYRYDSSLSPSLEWDGKNSVRELGEWLLACIEDATKLAPPHEFADPSVFCDEAGRRV